MDFPRYHKQIVNELIDGKFLLRDQKSFPVLKENEDFYSKFFKESFDYVLKVSSEYAYLTSSDSNETLSRDTSIFFAILCYELDKDGRNFLDQLNYAEFDVEQIESYFTNSAYIDLILSNKQLRDRESRRNFLNMMSRRNIIEKLSDDKFTFTPAYKVFIDFAADLAKRRLAKADL